MADDSEQEQTMKQCFDRFDVNHDGTMSVDELHIAFRQMYWDVSKKELQDIMRELDTDESDTISYEEFKRLMQRKPSDEETDKELRAAFSLFDEGKGEIPVDKFRIILQNKGEYLADEEFENVMKDADVDESGTINCDGKT